MKVKVKLPPLVKRILCKKPVAGHQFSTRHLSLVTVALILSSVIGGAFGSSGWLPSGLATAVADPVPPPEAEWAVDPVFQGFEPNSEYDLMAAEEVLTEAQIYLSRQAGSALLVRVPQPQGPWILLRPAEKRLERVQKKELMVRGNGVIDLQQVDKRPEIGQFAVVEGRLTLSLGEQRLHLVEKPPLLGLMDSAALLAAKPEYGLRASRYSLASRTVRALQEWMSTSMESDGSIRIRVYFGTWCPRCGRSLPKLLKLEQEMGDAAMFFEYFGLPLHRQDAPDAFWQEAAKLKVFQDDVGTVPVAFVYKGKKEIGNIVGSGWGNPEAELRKILEKVTK